MDADLDTLATALYVTTDDLLSTFPERAPWRPRIGFTPKITDAELVSLTVLQALLGAPAKSAGSGTPTRTCGTCSRTCRSSRPTTSGCAP